MKRLILTLLLLSPIWAIAQTGNPMSDAMDAFYRANGGKGFSQNDYTNAEKSLVRSKADTSQIKFIAPVRSVNGLFGNVVLGKAHIGLPLVPNIDATNPANIVWTSSYRTVTDVDKANWNGYQTLKVDKDLPNTISAPHNFTGDGLTFSTDVYRNIAPIASQARMYGYPQGYNGTHTSQTFYAFDGDTKQPRMLYIDGYGRMIWDNTFEIYPAGDIAFYKLRNAAVTAGQPIPGRFKIAAVDTSLNVLKKVSIAELMRSVGTVTPAADNAYNSGSSSLRWASVYSVSSLMNNLRMASSSNGLLVQNASGSTIAKFFDNGNFKISNFETDAGYKFAVNGGTLFAGSLSPAATAGITYTANLTNPVVTATANNQVLIGQQFSPTFSAGSFTGVTSYGVDFNTNLRVGGNIAFTADNTYFLGTSTARLAGVSSVIYNATLIKANATDIQFQNSSSTQAARMFSTGNWVLGTSTTDAGYRLDVGGTTRIGGSVTPSADISYNVGSSSARLLNVWANVLNGDVIKPTTGDLTFQSAGYLDRGRIFNSSGNWNIGPTNTDTGYKLNVEGSTNVTGAATFQSTVNVTGITTLTDLAATNVGAGSILPNGSADLLYKNSGGTQVARMFNSSGNYLLGSGTTDAGYKLDVNGNLRVSSTTALSDQVTINKTTTGSGLIINAGPGSGGTTFGLHVNGSTGSQSGGLRLHQSSSTGVNVLQFTNTSGIIAQWWQGSSGDSYAPNALGLQAVKGNLDIGLYESGKAFRIGTAIGMSTPPFIVEPVNGNITAGSIKVSTGGFTGISAGASTTTPAGTIAYSGGHFFGSDGSNWKQLDN